MVVDPFDPKKTLPRHVPRPTFRAEDNGAAGGGSGGSPGGGGGATAEVDDLVSSMMTTSLSTPIFGDVVDERDGAAASSYNRRGGGGGHLSDDDEDFAEPNTWTRVSPTATLRPTDDFDGAVGGGGEGGGSSASQSDKNQPKLVNAEKNKDLMESDHITQSGSRTAAERNNGVDSPAASPTASRRSPPPPPVPPRKPTPSPSPLNSPGGSPPASRRPLPPPPPSSSTNNNHGSSSSHAYDGHDVVAPPLPRARNAGRAHCKETQTGKQHGAGVNVPGSNGVHGGGPDGGSRPNSVDMSATPPRHPPPPPVPSVLSPESALQPQQQRRHSQPRSCHSQQQQQPHDSFDPNIPSNSHDLLPFQHSRTESSSPRPLKPAPHPHDNATSNNNNNNNNHSATPPRALPPEIPFTSRMGHESITPLDPPSTASGAQAVTNGATESTSDSSGNSPSLSSFDPFSALSKSNTTGRTFLRGDNSCLGRENIQY